jgi:transposase
MRKPIYVRSITDAEQHALQAGLRSANAFVLRRCQILLASARGQQARGIAKQLGCDDQTVRNAIHVFNARGLAALRRGSSAPHHTPHAVFDSDHRESLRTLLHQSPRTFGKPTSVWTLRLVAEVAYAEGIIPRPVSGETIRHALAALKTRWKRAKRWITSPDPAYLRKKNSATASSA